MNPCIRCGAPTDAYVCRPEAQALAVELLRAAGHAEDVEAVITRQTRYGGGGRGGSDEPMPGDFTASAKLAPIVTAIGGWARIVSEETGRRPHWRPAAGPLCRPTGRPCIHDSCQVILRRTRPTALARDAAWLARQVEWLRKHPAAAEAFRDLEKACADLARLNDSPPDRELVGMCDCGKVLYARHSQAFITCPVTTCKLVWNVPESRDILREALRGKLFTASECARLAAFWNERTQPQIRALMTTWTRPDRHRIEARGWIPNDDYTGDGDEPQGWSLYLLGDVLDLLAQTPRRNREGAAA